MLLDQNPAVYMKQAPAIGKQILKETWWSDLFKMGHNVQVHNFSFSMKTVFNDFSKYISYI